MNPRKYEALKFDVRVGCLIIIQLSGFNKFTATSKYDRKINCHCSRKDTSRE